MPLDSLKDQNHSMFFNVFAAGTSPDAQNFGRIWNDQVKLQVYPTPRGAMIGSIRAFEPGNGHAKLCLKWLCAQADIYGVAMHLMASAGPRRDQTPEEAQESLIQWYKSLGFEQNGENANNLIRRPQSTQDILHDEVYALAGG